MKMKTLFELALLLYLGFHAAQTEASSARTAASNVTTTECDAENRCTCVVHTPEPCPADTVYSDLMEAQSQLNVAYSRLSGDKVTRIRTTIDGLVVRMNTLESSLHNQSIMISVRELSSILDEAFMMQSSLDNFTTTQNNTVIQQIQGEMAAIEQTLFRISEHDPLVFKDGLKREINQLRERLRSCTERCERKQDFSGDGLPVNHTINQEMCTASRNLSIGPPIMYKYRKNVEGMWLKDPLPVNETEKTKIYEMRQNSGYYQKLYSYANIEDYKTLGSETSAVASKCSFSIYGQKLLYLRGTIYYSYYSSSDRLQKVDAFNAQSCSTDTVSSTFTLPNTNANYIGNTFNDADFNFDETGLYVVFADDNSDLSIIRLNPDTLEEEVRWNTGKPKRTVANIFMVCGRLYSIDDYSSRHLTGLQWGYDTNTGEEFTYELNMESLFGDVQALSYNPRERAIFGWDNNHPVLYHLFF